MFRNDDDIAVVSTSDRVLATPVRLYSITLSSTQNGLPRSHEDSCFISYLITESKICSETMMTFFVGSKIDLHKKKKNSKSYHQSFFCVDGSVLLLFEYQQSERLKDVSSLCSVVILHHACPPFVLAERRPWRTTDASRSWGRSRPDSCAACWCSCWYPSI